MKHFFAVAVFTFTINILMACGNENYAYSQSKLPLDANGKILFKNLLEGLQISDRGYQLPYWQYGFMDATKQRLDSVEKAMKTNKDYKLLSDYCWLKIKLGKVKEVLPTLQQLYVQYPNDYNIVANLGTAYELVGNNKMALELIQKAVAINPQSHFGSEWLHVNLLNAKVNESNNNNLISLSVDPQNYNNWLYQIKLSNHEMDSFITVIAYQLHERMHFVKPQDKYVAALLLHFADLVAKRYDLTTALPFFNQALLFYNNLDRFINNRFFSYTPKPEVIKKAPTNLTPLYIIIAFIVGAIVSFLIGQRK